jgi:membrane associated rhomboid family serine protease
MRRGVRSFREALSFGGRVPPAVGGVLAAMLLASVVAWTSAPGDIGSMLALWPEKILEGEIWRLVAWPFVQPHPFTLLFVGLTLFWLGQQLASEWGEGTFLVRLLVIAAGAGVATSVAGLFWPAADVPYAGGWPVTVALLLAWALLHPGAQLSFFGVVPMNGRLLVRLIVFGAVLWAIFDGPGAMVPHFSAMAIAWLQVTGRLGGRRLWLRTRQRWLEAKLARRRRHLKTVGRNGEEDPPRWVN